MRVFSKGAAGGGPGQGRGDRNVEAGDGGQRGWFAVRAFLGFTYRTIWIEGIWVPSSWSCFSVSPSHSSLGAL